MSKFASFLSSHTLLVCHLCNVLDTSVNVCVFVNNVLATQIFLYWHWRAREMFASRATFVRVLVSFPPNKFAQLGRVMRNLEVYENESIGIPYHFHYPPPSLPPLSLSLSLSLYFSLSLVFIRQNVINM